MFYYPQFERSQNQAVTAGGQGSQKDEGSNDSQTKEIILEGLEGETWGSDGISS